MDGRKQRIWKGCWIGLSGCAAVGVLLLVGVVGLFQGSQAQVVPESLRAIHLAPIPREARDVRAAGASNLFSAEARVRFQAPPEVIERYLADSPALQHVKPERFSPTHRLIPLSEKLQLQDAKSGFAGEGDATYQPSRLAPWYTPRITVAGRRYVIPEDQRQFNGEVILDDAAGLVFITVNRS